MNGCVFPTDFDWYTRLSATGPHDEVNFWRPSIKPFKILRPGEPLFFKLKAPHNAVAGFGWFQHWSPLPDWMAWDSFGTGNGTADFADLSKRLGAIRRRNSMERSHVEIGCIILARPVFFPRDLWVPQPVDWRPQTVSGKRYSLDAGVGLRLFQACMERAAVGEQARQLETVDLPALRGKPALIQPRLGQGTFRVAVTDAYDRACAVTREHSLPVLDAAHIIPFAEGGHHDVSNGVLLRTDIHRLFDRGYVTVDTDHRLVVSRRLEDHYDNGKVYYAMNGQRLSVPTPSALRPDAAALHWHQNNVFLG